MEDVALNKIFTFDMNNKTVDQDAKLSEAVTRMARCQKNCLLVKKGEDKPVGIISEHDIVVAFARLGKNASNARVLDYMTIDVVAAKETDTLNDALKLMAAHNVRHLPILSENGQIVDFVSMMDLIVKKMQV